jgi:hypothetical protein
MRRALRSNEAELERSCVVCVLWLLRSGPASCIGWSYCDCSGGWLFVPKRGTMSGHDAKYFTTTKKGEIHELKEELNSQYKVGSPFPPREACCGLADSFSVFRFAVGGRSG